MKMAAPNIPNIRNPAFALAVAREEYIAKKDAFLTNVGENEWPRIERISQTDNPYLWPYYSQFKERMTAYPIGIFIIDPRGVYVPIEKGDCGVVHVERLPLVRSPIYGLTDLSKCASFHDGERVIIFQGVFPMSRYGWRFINDSFQVKPIAGITPIANRILRTNNGGELKVEETCPAEQGEEDEFMN